MSHEVAVNILLEYVDSGCRKLARADPPLEEQVQLGKRTARGFRHAIINIDDAKKTAGRLLTCDLALGRSMAAARGMVVTYPEEARIIPPIPRPRIQHVGGQNAANNADNDAAPKSA